MASFHFGYKIRGPSLTKPSYRKHEYFFPFLCVIGAFAILSSTMSKNPVLNPFAESLGTPEAVMGFIAAASTIPGILISLPAGSLSDIFERERVLLASSIVFASAPFLYLPIGSWWQLILVRFYHGFATAIFVPVAREAIAEHYPSKRGEKISTFTSATIVGRSIAPFLGGFILSITIWNYHTYYLVVSVAGLAALLTTMMLVKNKGGEIKIQTASIRSRTSDQNAELRPIHGWREVMRNPGIIVATAIDAAAYYVYGAVEFFLVGYLKKIALLDASMIGIITGMQIALIPVLSPFFGRLSDKVGRKIPIATGLVIGGLPLLAISQTTQFLPLLVISMTYGLGFVLVTSSTPALVGDVAHKESYGAAMGFLATIMDVGQTLGPIVTGFLLAMFGYSGSFASLGLILLGFCVFFVVYQKLASSKQTLDR